MKKKSKISAILIAVLTVSSTCVYGKNFAKTSVKYNETVVEVTPQELSDPSTFTKSFTPEEQYGYDFVSWDTSECENKALQFKPFNKWCEIKPNYKKHEFNTVLFDDEGNVVIRKKVPYEGKIGEIKPIEKENYDFLNFKDVETEEIIDENSISDKDRGIIGVYEPKKWQVTYNLAGGSLSNKGVEQYTFGEKTPLPKPYRDGYDFAGWIDEVGKGHWEISEGTSGELNLTAAWKPNIFTAHPDEGPGGRLFVPKAGYTSKIYYRGATLAESQALCDLPDTCVDIPQGHPVEHLFADHAKQGFNRAVNCGIGSDVVIVKDGVHYNYKIEKWTTGQNLKTHFTLDSGEDFNSWASGYSIIMYTCAQVGTDVPIFIAAAR